MQNEQHETDEDICVWSNGCWFTSARKTYEEMARQYKRKGLVWNVDCSFKTENCSAVVTAVMDTLLSPFSWTARPRTKNNLKLSTQLK